MPNNKDYVEDNYNEIDDVDIVVDEKLIEELNKKDQQKEEIEAKKKELYTKHLELKNKIFDGTNKNTNVENFKEYLKLTKEKWLNYYKNDEIVYSNEGSFDKTKAPTVRFKMEKMRPVETKEDITPISLTLNNLFKKANMKEIAPIFHNRLDDVVKQIGSTKTKTGEKEVGFTSVYANTLHLDSIFDYIEKKYSKEEIEKSIKFADNFLRKLKDKQISESEKTKERAKEQNDNTKEVPIDGGDIRSTAGLKSTLRDEKKAPDPMEVYKVETDEYDYMYSASRKLHDQTTIQDKVLAYSKTIYDMNRIHQNRFWSMIFHPFQYFDEKKLINNLKDELESFKVPKEKIDALVKKGAEYNKETWEESQKEYITYMKYEENHMDAIEESEEEEEMDFEDSKKLQDKIFNDINKDNINVSNSELEINKEQSKQVDNTIENTSEAKNEEEIVNQ